MARTLYTLAFPKVSERDRLWIDRIRSRHDASAPLVAPHFTLVFASEGLDERDYAAHVAGVATRSAALDFVCRRTVAWPEHGQQGGNVFLVPDEGNSAILQLHDLLYRGVLAGELRLDIPFVPHLTIGRCGSLQQAKAVSDALNAEPIRIAGSIREISVVGLRDDVLAVLARFPLRG